MLFCSQQYVIFFAVLLALYWAIPSSRVRVWLLLAASLDFYACWNRWLALLIVATSIMDYAVGLGLDAWRSERNRKGLLLVSLGTNLGMLAAFKYANFFLGSLEATLNACGAQASLPLLRVILPVGISFYTFEAVNYTVDVYRRRIPAERSLPHFLLFVTFFPHLVAGPIVRARDFLPQIRRVKRWSWSRAEVGIGLFLIGLFKKMAIADRMAAYVDPVFGQPGVYGTYAAWIATVAYTIQIYCDFSGYTDMALGSAHLLGYKLAANFRMPYLAANISEFWRRWHISLSSWLRDYLFIPLGGSRGTNWQTARNLLVTMTLGGLWHGASWTFVVWGLLHGGVLIAHRGFQSVCKTGTWLDRTLRTSGGTIVRVALTLLTVGLGWVFFRATTFATASTIIQRLFTFHNGLAPPVATGAFWALIGVVAASHAMGSFQGWKTIAARLPAPALGFGYAIVLTMALLLAPNSGNAFIYFQF